MTYVEKAKNRSDMERKVGKDKSGIELVGLYAKHPFTEVKRAIPIYVADYVLMDYGTGCIMGVPGHDERDNDFAKKYGLEIVYVIEPPVTESTSLYTGDGIMVNSADYTGLPSKEFYTKAIERLDKENKGKRAVTYRIRDWVFSRQRYWGEPIPIIHKQDGSMEPEKELPLELPFSKDYTAEKDGTPPLGKLPNWIRTKDSEGKPATRETQTMPTWAGSSWYFIRYVDPKNKEAFADREKMKYWLPVDRYFGGAEHTTVHLLYSRFWFKFFHDIGLVPYSEPYHWRMNGGLLLGPDGRKMSKRFGNIVEPGVLIDNYGADATRLALAFIGPYSDTYPWNENTIKAMWRLVKNIYNLKDKVTTSTEEPAYIQNAYNRMLVNVNEMVENLKMNTAISEIMIFVNILKKANSISIDTWKGFVKAIAPFTPFVAEELWHDINDFSTWDKNNSVHLQSWPVVDNNKIRTTSVIIPVMINGKIRGTIETYPSDSEEDIKKRISTNPKLSAYYNHQTLRKFIFIQDKIVSILT